MLATPPSYAFNASAIALGGVLRQGNQSTTIPTIGSVCLATAGGEAENTVDNYFRDDISLGHARTRVSGYSTALSGGTSRRYTTYSEVTLQNLKIFDRLAIGYMKAIVQSTRVIDTQAPEQILQLQPDQSQFSIIVRYENIFIDGEEVAATDYEALCSASTYDNFLNEAANVAAGAPADSDESFEAVKKVKKLRDDKPDDLLGNEESKKVVPWHRPPINVPLVKLSGPPGLVAPHGNRANVQTFGKARFGDAIIKPDRLRVTLLRLSLDTDWSKTKSGQPILDALADQMFFASDGPSGGGGGSLSGGDGGNNGVPIWP